MVEAQTLLITPYALCLIKSLGFVFILRELYIRKSLLLNQILFQSFVELANLRFTQSRLLGTLSDLKIP